MAWQNPAIYSCALCTAVKLMTLTFCAESENRVPRTNTPHHITPPGDSLTRLSTSTLAAILRAKPIELDTFGDVWEACGGELKVRFIRNDYLDARVAPRYASPMCEEFPGGATALNTRCRLFGTDATLRDFDTLVVNSGAHPRPAAQYGRQMDAAAEALTRSMNRLHGKDKAILVVRNTVPGHWGCTER